MLTRALATLTLVLTLSGGADPRPPAGNLQVDRVRTARRAHLVDDLEGCREPAPAAVPLAAACTDGGQP
jgi:hypothetical protein